MANNGRNTTCTIIIGAQRTGKTTFAKKIQDAYPKKSLVVCPDDMERAWFSNKLIALHEIPTLEKGRYRIVYDPKAKDFLSGIVDVYKHGLLIWDDAKAYFNNYSRITELEAMLLRRRQFNLDIIFMYHGFSTVPPLLWTYATHLALFRTNDAYQRAKDKTYRYEELAALQERIKIKAQENPFYHEIVLLQ